MSNKPLPNPPNPPQQPQDPNFKTWPLDPNHSTLTPAERLILNNLSTILEHTQTTANLLTKVSSRINKDHAALRGEREIIPQVSNLRPDFDLTNHDKWSVGGPEFGGNWNQRVMMGHLGMIGQVASKLRQWVGDLGRLYGLEVVEE
jgi:hypothetical protein